MMFSEEKNKNSSKQQKELEASDDMEDNDLGETSSAEW